MCSMVMGPILYFMDKICPNIGLLFGIAMIIGMTGSKYVNCEAAKILKQYMRHVTRSHPVIFAGTRQTP